MSKLRFKTERVSVDDESFRRTQVDMPMTLIAALDRIKRQLGIEKRAELIRMFLVKSVKQHEESEKRKEGRSESTKGGVGGRSNDGRRQKRRAG